VISQNSVSSAHRIEGSEAFGLRAPPPICAFLVPGYPSQSANSDASLKPPDDITAQIAEIEREIIAEQGIVFQSSHSRRDAGLSPFLWLKLRGVTSIL
jgi:hypothetical protein